MAIINKRIFDTDNALKGSFNGWWGKWQIITYLFFVLGYSIIIGWINRLSDYNLLQPKMTDEQCNLEDQLFNHSYINRTIIQRLSGKSKYQIQIQANETGGNETISNSLPVELKYNETLITKDYGITVLSEYGIVCDMLNFKPMPRFSHFFGYIFGALILGFGSDRGGRKIIILACIWTTGIMSLFQIVGHDFISFVFFQFFIGLFIGGIQASFLPAIIEMFPINFRAFYGIFFHLIICLFELLLPWLAKSFKSWKLLQIFVSAPIVVTAVLQWLVNESIFWYLANKEYDKAINVLTKLAKRNGIQFDTKFKQAKDFLHAKHSKAIQVDILPLLRLQDIDHFGKKYKDMDMAEEQKKKANGSKLRVFLNSLKGESYRSTNTIYRPFDFIYSPTLFVYVLILSGLWFTNGLTDSMEAIRPVGKFDFYIETTLSNLSCVLSSTLAIVLAIFKTGRRWMIFLAYLVIEVCFLGSLIAQFSNDSTDICRTKQGIIPCNAENADNAKNEQTQIALTTLYHVCKFSTHFGFMFLMLITAELFPTSLRCTGMGICFSLKMLGSFISSKEMLNNNTTMHRLAYCLLTLFFGSMTLFLPETKTFPLPRSILQIEAMPTTIGKKLRSRKVKLACERRQNELADSNNNSRISDKNRIYKEVNTNEKNFNSPNSNNNNRSDSLLLKDVSANANENVKLIGKSEATNSVYDTVTSVHDIEQDDHFFHKELLESKINEREVQKSLHPTYDRTKFQLTKIPEVSSKNITRNNSFDDINNSKV